MIDQTSRIAIALGDPAGIGPETVAKLLSKHAKTSKDAVLLIGDRSEVEHGMDIAGERFEYRLVNRIESIIEARPSEILLYDYRGDTVGPFKRGIETSEGGRYTLDTLRVCLHAAETGLVGGICYAPLNKTSMHLAGMEQSDELHWFVDELQHQGPFSEINIIDSLWTSRVTSHVALKDVSKHLTEESIFTAAKLLYSQRLRAGHDNIKMAICGLNPHNGDNGAFGNEEIDIIYPAVKLAQNDGIPVSGPYPADTIFVRAQQNEFNSIVTMYHDQGQIAIKLLGFWRGVTLNGGLDIPIATPAHGTAFDIVEQGNAHVGPLENAYELVSRMVSRRRET